MPRAEMHPRAKDLTGQRFGQLTAVEPTEERSSGGGVIWRCVCSCGGEAQVQTDQLTGGRTRSCGCLNREQIAEVGRQIHRHLTGRRFGRLTVLRPTEERRDRQIVWLCRCDCGNTTLVRTNSLTCGNTRSCGCLLNEARSRWARSRETIHRLSD